MMCTDDTQCHYHWRSSCTYPIIFISLIRITCLRCVKLLSEHITGGLQLGPIFQMKLSGESSSNSYQINELILSDVKLLSKLIT